MTSSKACWIHDRTGGQKRSVFEIDQIARYGGGAEIDGQPIGVLSTRRMDMASLARC